MKNMKGYFIMYDGREKAKKLFDIHMVMQGVLKIKFQIKAELF